MYSHELSSCQKHVLTACRALTTVAAALSLAIFAIVLRQRTTWSPDGASRSTAPNYLPVIACAYSIVFNVISAAVHWNRSLYIGPRPLYLVAELIAALLLVVLGYLGFVYDVITYWKTGLDGGTPQHVELLGIVLLSIVHLVHVAFFLYGWKSSTARREQKRPLSAPPAYTRNAMTAFEELYGEDAAKSMRSLPEYQAFSYCSRDSLEKENEERDKIPGARTEEV